MHSESDNKEMEINYKADEAIEKVFKSLLKRYENNLETPLGSSDFLFDCVHLLYYKYHKINLKHSGSYIDSPNYIIYKNASTNLINKKDNKSF